METKAIQNVKYYKNPSAKYKLPVIPSFKDFGDDTPLDAVHKKLKDVLAAATNALKSYMKISLGKGSKDLSFFFTKMADRSSHFVEEVLKYMNSMYRELNEAFGDDSAGDTWESTFPHWRSFGQNSGQHVS